MTTGVRNKVDKTAVAQKYVVDMTDSVLGTMAYTRCLN